MFLPKTKKPTGHVRQRTAIGLLLALLTISLPAPVFAEADKLTAPQLIALANSNSPALLDAINTSMDAKDLRSGTAWLGHGPDFFFATEAPSKPTLIIDDAPGPPDAARRQLSSVVRSCAHRTAWQVALLLLPRR